MCWRLPPPSCGGMKKASEYDRIDDRIITHRRTPVSADTKIEWTNVTWNPVLGCSKTSPGCANCYATRTVYRMSHSPNEKIAAANAGLTYRQENGIPNWTGVVRVLPQRLGSPFDLTHQSTIFVNSLSDLFHEDVPVEFIQRVFGVMRATPWHVFQILTKRAERLEALSPEIDWPENVWQGVSVENQAYTFRVDHLRRTGAKTKFLSIEPQLGHIELDLTGIDWVITGGESGPNAREFDPAWAASVRDQSIAAGVKFFHKQHGVNVVGSEHKNKKLNGRLLDGHEYNEMPPIPAVAVPSKKERMALKAELAPESLGELIQLGVRSNVPPEAKHGPTPATFSPQELEMTQLRVSPMNCYRVVNVRASHGPCVYVGRAGGGRRGHPLANPHKLKANATPDERAACIAKYRAWLQTLPDLAERLESLRVETNNGERPLGCWCAPLPCHADVLCEFLAAAVPTANSRAVTVHASTSSETRTAFDLSFLSSADQSVVDSCACDVHEFVRRGSEDAIRIGKKLRQAKALLGHGRFLAWLQAEFTWSADTAGRFMKVAERFGDIPHCAEFALTAYYILAGNSVSEEAREEALGRAAKGEKITRAVACQIMNKHAPKPVVVLGSAELDPDEDDDLEGDEEVLSAELVVGSTLASPATTTTGSNNQSTGLEAANMSYKSGPTVPHPGTPQTGASTAQTTSSAPSESEAKPTFESLKRLLTDLAIVIPPLPLGTWDSEFRGWYFGLARVQQWELADQMAMVRECLAERLMDLTPPTLPQ